MIVGRRLVMFRMRGLFMLSAAVARVCSRFDRMPLNDQVQVGQQGQA